MTCYVEFDLLCGVRLATHKTYSYSYFHVQNSHRNVRKTHVTMQKNYVEL